MSLDPSCWQHARIVAALVLALCLHGLPVAARAANAAVEAGRSAISAGDYATASRLLQGPAQAGDPVAQNALGVLHEKGWGVPQDLEAALGWYRRAAEQGDVKGQFNLGRMYLQGLGVARDPAHAIGWLQRAAEQGYPEAMYLLGGVHADAQGVARNYAEAARWWRRAAESGLPQALTALGTLYGRGEGVPRDPAAAAGWYRKAADSGDADAQWRLGAMHLDGEGVAPDPAEAERWIRKSASAGDPNGMLRLAYLHVAGVGVPEDLEEAARWIGRALSTARDKGIALHMTDPQGDSSDSGPSRRTTRLFRAMSIEPAQLGQSWFAVDAEMRGIRAARAGGSRIVSMDGKRLVVIEPADADSHLTRLDGTLRLLSVAIRERGFERLAGEYDLSSRGECGDIALTRGRTIIEQDGFRLRIANATSMGGAMHEGIVVESAVLIRHASHPERGLVARSVDGRIEYDVDAGRCTASLVRRQAGLPVLPRLSYRPASSSTSPSKRRSSNSVLS